MHQPHFSRRLYLKTTLAAALLPRALRAAEAVWEIGGRRELFVDDYLIERLTGASLKMHRPVPREVVLTCDAPWEGNTSAYYTLFADGDRFRMYYRGAHVDENKKTLHPDFTCYAESRDGVTWEKPALGLFEFAGSKANNIVWTGEGTHNFAPFKDNHTACKPEATYKALAGGTTLVDGKKKSCLHAYQSPDGIHWSRMVEEPVITAGAFDSQNIAFYDAGRGEYRAYWRIFTAGFTDERGWKPAGQRAIRTATSRDFLHWEQQADLRYFDSPAEHLYTNAVMPYFRAPHLFIGFPTRFQPKNEQVEPIFMSSRDGVLFRRWSEPLIPIDAPQDRDGNRSNYMTRALLQLPGQERELSVYATEAYYTGPGSRVRRFTFRTDGFVSVNAGAAGGEVVTRPLRFDGGRLLLNFATATGGSVRAELQDAAGKPLAGYALEDCPPFAGDDLEHPVTWRGGADLSALQGRPVRLRLVLKNADVFALRFGG